MMPLFRGLIVLLLFSFSAVLVRAQYAYSYYYLDLDSVKSKKYKNKELKAEKTNFTKFSFLKHFAQNTYTHYNYYFNANEKIKEITDQAEKEWADAYYKLLPFYAYDKEKIAQNKNEINQAISTINAGIVLHDLRNDWIDNLYLLMGKSLYYRKDYDTALSWFKLINYAYAPKQDGYDLLIGSNVTAKDGVFSISTKEERSFLQKLTQRLPDRNESFIWQIRSLTELGRYVEAEGLFKLLLIDVNFPKRLYGGLYEAIAFCYYQQRIYGLSAEFLEKNITLEKNKNTARKAYLAGQMYALAKRNNDAQKMFYLARDATKNALLEIFATMQVANLELYDRTQKKETYLSIINSIAAIAKKNRFKSHKDEIYYACAQIAIDSKDTATAEKYLQQTIKISQTNELLKAKSYAALGMLQFAQEQYQLAGQSFDSVQTTTLKTYDSVLANTILKLRKPLAQIAKNNANIAKQDSLLLLSAMPEEERKIAVKTILSQQRKANRLAQNAAAASLLNNSGTPLLQLNSGFSTSSVAGYFSSERQKKEGWESFQSIWGNRPNVDNWGRTSALKSQLTNKELNTNLATSTAPSEKIDEALNIDENVLDKLPLSKKETDEMLLNIQKAHLTNAVLFQYDLALCKKALTIYLKYFQTQNLADKARYLYNLMLCYECLDNATEAVKIKQTLIDEFPHSEFAKTLTKDKQDKDYTAQETLLDAIHQDYVNGNITAAWQKKQLADSLYKNKKTTPSLEIIEAAYQLQNGKDSIAITILNRIIEKKSDSTWVLKAKNMKKIVEEKTKIVHYLTQLEVERDEDYITKRIDFEKPTGVQRTIPVLNTRLHLSSGAISPLSLSFAKPLPIEFKNEDYSFLPRDTQMVLIIFKKVDRTYTSEAIRSIQNYNEQSFFKENLQVQRQSLNDSVNLILVGKFVNAIKALQYMDKIKEIAATKLMAWIKPAQYEFSIISTNNLKILATKKNYVAYYQLLQQTLPDKF